MVALKKRKGKKSFLSLTQKARKRQLKYLRKIIFFSLLMVWKSIRLFNLINVCFGLRQMLIDLVSINLKTWF